MIEDRLYEKFRYIGRDIFDAGLTSSHGGNMSMRVGDRIIIKRRGAQFRRLKPEDFVETRLFEKDSGIVRASTELIVHREIYQRMFSSFQMERVTRVRASNGLEYAWRSPSHIRACAQIDIAPQVGSRTSGMRRQNTYSSSYRQAGFLSNRMAPEISHVLSPGHVGQPFRRGDRLHPVVGVDDSRRRQI